jgi:hypothetical protein
VKRLFLVMSVTAMLNLAGLAAVCVLMWQRGWLERDRVQTALAALKGETEPVAASAPTTAPAEIVAADERIARDRDAEMIRHAELERRAGEIELGWAQLETQQLAFLRQIEEFETKKKQAAAEAAARASTDDEGGWRKQVELIGAMKPKMARDVLRDKEESEVVRLIMDLDARTARKIIGRILDQLHERDATQAEALGAGNGRPSQGA